MNLIERLRNCITFSDPLLTPEAADEIEHLTAENAVLKAFAYGILKDHPDLDMEGGYVQDLAVKHGLIVTVPVTEPCGEGCNCCEYYGLAPDGKFCETENCYQVADFVKG